MQQEPKGTSIRSWFRYSLRSLLLVMLLVAVYLGGRVSTLPRNSPPAPIAGNWQAHLPAGFKQPVTLKHKEGNHFFLSSKASVFDGVYQWKDNQLKIVEPRDKRMKGLTWSWNGQQWTLTGEPPDTPTGPSYLGATMTRDPVSKDK